MHQELLQCVIYEEYIFVQAVLLLMVLTHVLLWDEVQQEVNHVNSHVWVADTSVHDHGDCTDKLHLEVSICSEVDFRLNLLEKLWILSQVLDQDLGQSLEVHRERLRRLFN